MLTGCAWRFVIQQSTAKHHAQSVKMALTEDLTQKQYTFDVCTLYVSYCASFNIKFERDLQKKQGYMYIVAILRTIAPSPASLKSIESKSLQNCECKIQ